MKPNSTFFRHPQLLFTGLTTKSEVRLNFIARTAHGLRWVIPAQWDSYDYNTLDSSNSGAHVDVNIADQERDEWTCPTFVGIKLLARLQIDFKILWLHCMSLNLTSYEPCKRTYCVYTHSTRINNRGGEREWCSATITNSKSSWLRSGLSAVSRDKRREGTRTLVSNHWVSHNDFPTISVFPLNPSWRRKSQLVIFSHVYSAGSTVALAAKRRNLKAVL